MAQPRVIPQPEQDDEGYMLVACVVMCFVILLALSVAAPAVAKQLQHDKELESQHRAQQYVRAIRLYYRKNHNYPTSIDQLVSSNNQRFLREQYVDPLTGKADWRLIHFGENKTTVKGFFGKDLPGLAPGLGAAAGLQSSTGNSGASSSSSTAAAGGTGLAGSSSGSSFGGSSSFGSSSFGSSGSSGSGAGSAFGGGSGSTASGTGTPGSSATSGASGSSGISSQSASAFGSSTVGPIIGIGSAKSGEAMLVVNEQDQYQDWEFLYDPRIEQMYAKGQLNGGGLQGGSGTSNLNGSGTTGGAGSSTNGSSSGFGSSGSSSFGSSSGFGSQGNSNTGSGFGSFGGSSGSSGASSAPTQTPASPH